MNIEGTSKNSAAAKLEALVEGALFMRDAKVLLKVEDATALLAYIAELESKGTNREKLAVGDEVVIAKDDSGIHTWMVGRAGVVVEINEDNDKLPVVIEFPSKLRARAHYTEVTKIVKEEEPVAAAKFKLGQKVETLKEIQAQGMVVKAGTVGTVMEIDPLRVHEFEVMFSGAMGTHSFGFDADELKAV